MQPLENIKDGGGMFGINAYAIVTDGDNPFFLHMLCRYMNTWGLFSPELNAIADEVLEKLNNLYMIC